MSKTVEDELAEADRIHGLAVKMKAQGDLQSANALEAKVRSKRKRAIRRLGKAPKRGTRSSGTVV